MKSDGVLCVRVLRAHAHTDQDGNKSSLLISDADFTTATGIAESTILGIYFLPFYSLQISGMKKEGGTNYSVSN